MLVCAVSRQNFTQLFASLLSGSRFPENGAINISLGGEANSTVPLVVTCNFSKLHDVGWQGNLRKECCIFHRRRVASALDPAFGNREILLQGLRICRSLRRRRQLPLLPGCQVLATLLAAAAPSCWLSPLLTQSSTPTVSYSRGNVEVPRVGLQHARTFVPFCSAMEWNPICVTQQPE